MDKQIPHKPNNKQLSLFVKGVLLSYSVACAKVLIKLINTCLLKLQIFQQVNQINNPEWNSSVDAAVTSVGEIKGSKGVLTM